MVFIIEQHSEKKKRRGTTDDLKALAGQRSRRRGT